MGWLCGMYMYGLSGLGAGLWPPCWHMYMYIHVHACACGYVHVVCWVFSDRVMCWCCVWHNFIVDCMLHGLWGHSVLVNIGTVQFMRKSIMPRILKH